MVGVKMGFYNFVVYAFGGKISTTNPLVAEPSGHDPLQEGLVTKLAHAGGASLVVNPPGVPASNDFCPIVIESCPSSKNISKK